MKRILLVLILISLLGIVLADMPHIPVIPDSEQVVAAVSPIEAPLKDDTHMNQFMVAGLLSILIEFLIICLLYKPLLGRAIGRPIEWLRLFLIVAGATLVTISILWWILTKVLLSPVSYLVLGELFVVIAEAVAYRFLVSCKWRDAFLFSTVANLGSYFFGFFLMRILF